ncbi:restriction endonuclease subunit S [Clostridium sp. C8]|uniref:restriction endonuclease subunit S n=1 Tax=Clostridium sp. C8 TaxID=1667357 RepID=UPI000B2FD75C|nr:restriction endonuclease subunit S [Clostridium sp. C8]
MAQAIFKQWFVDFEFPNENGEPYKSSGGEMVESELGMIPKGWDIGVLSDLVNIKYGKDHKKLEDGKIPVFGSGGVMRYVDKALYEKESVLIPRKGTLNNVIYVNEPFWSVDTMFFTEMKLPNIAKFVYQFVKLKDLVNMNIGSAVPSMTTAILNTIHVVIPCKEILDKFDGIITSFYSQIQFNDKNSENLVNIRDTLLPKLMSGEIDVSKIDV